MKLFLYLILLISASSFAADLLSPKPIKWVPVIGYKDQGTRGFYDKNSVNEIKDSNSRVVFGNILVVSDKVVIGRYRGKVYQAKSMVRIIMVNCTNNYVTPIFDLYYDKEFPTNEDVPVHSTDYGNINEIVPLSKTSPLYYTLCPNYI